MEKIVQLRENEYNTLKKRADMNQAAIDKAMEQEIKKSCNITIELEMNVGRDWNDATYAPNHRDLKKMFPFLFV